MSSGSDTTRWATAFCDELARCGVREIVVAPGSRSTPLVMAFAADGRFRCRVHLDERSGAFFALGVGKATGRPAAVVTTSGTATANVFPAVIEAARSETPLLVLTADRPHHLRDSDANQAIDQVRLYGPFVREFFDVAPPTSDGAALAHLRGLAGRAVAAASGDPKGPVHLNFPFDKPLEPTPDEERALDESAPGVVGRPEDAPFVRIDSGTREASPEALEALVASLDTPRGVIVAGPSHDGSRLGPCVLALAEATGFPVLADPLSGCRYGPPGEVHVVAGYDLFLRDEGVQDALRPSLIVRVGSSPTSAALQRWITHHDGVQHVVVDGGGRWKDHGATATHYIHADAGDTLAAVAEVAGLSAADDWRARWRMAEAAMRAAQVVDEGTPHEGDVAGILSAMLPEGTNLFVSSSMPVRDLDAFGHAREGSLTVLGNRGASGIDGVVSTAYGVAAASEHPTVCLIGDVAFFHDQNGLLWSREADTAVVFVLIDNDGGGIFHMLPISEHEPDFTKFFATPHGLDFRHAAEMFDVVFRDCDVASIGEAVTGAIAAGGSHVLRVNTQRTESVVRRREVAEAVVRSVREVLG
jgi:2-succinyl-5-enolpyruvyl-6-hydroxy-3-cyclohexene-1-carboxylate synthase